MNHDESHGNQTVQRLPCYQAKSCLLLNPECNQGHQCELERCRFHDDYDESQRDRYLCIEINPVQRIYTQRGKESLHEVQPVMLNSRCSRHTDRKNSTKTQHFCHENPGKGKLRFLLVRSRVVTSTSGGAVLKGLG